MEEKHIDYIYKNYTTFLDGFENFLKPREIKSNNLKGESNEVVEWAYLNLNEKCNRFKIYQTEKGDFWTIYFAKLSSIKIKRKSKQNEIEFLMEKKPDVYTDPLNAFYYYIYKTKFETLKLFNKDMIINTKIVHHITTIIEYFQNEDTKLEYIYKKISDLTKFIENFYKPEGVGMIKAKSHFSDIVGALETKD